MYSTFYRLVYKQQTTYSCGMMNDATTACAPRVSCTQQMDYLHNKFWITNEVYMLRLRWPLSIKQGVQVQVDSLSGGIIPVVIEGTVVITAVDRLIQDVAEHQPHLQEVNILKHPVLIERLVHC